MGEKHLPEAFMWMKRAANQQVLLAQVYVVYALRTGAGAEKNEKVAMDVEAELLSKADNTDTVDKEYALQIGKELCSGTSLYKNIEKGVLLLSHAELSEHVEALIAICEACTKDERFYKENL